MEKSNVSSKFSSTTEEDLFFWYDSDNNDGVLPPKLKEKDRKQYEEASRKGLWFGN